MNDPVRWAGRLILCALAISGLAQGAQPAATISAQPLQNILVIDGERHDLTGTRAFETGMREFFAAHPAMAEFFVEHLDAGRFQSVQSRQAFARYLQERYTGRKIDLVVAFTETAAEFALAARPQLFPHAPVVLAAVSQKWVATRPLPAGIVAVPIDYDFRGTLELALELQPDLREVAVVHGTSAYDRARLEEAIQALAQFAPRLRYRTLGQLPLSEIEAEVRRLPHTSMVLQVSLVQNAEGKPVDGRDFAGRMAAISPVPVYAIFEAYLYKGALGGRMFDYTALGRATAPIMQQLLAGDDASAVHAGDLAVSSLLINWQALQKWRIPESRLPRDAKILLRPPSMWAEYRLQFVAAGAGLIVLILLIAVLLLELAWRRRAEDGLRESELRFRSIADAAPVMIWMSGPDKLYTFFNKGWLEFTGRTFEQELGNGWAEGVHPADVASCRATYERFFDARESFELEYRLQRRDGEYRWVFDSGVPRFAPDGTFLGYIGTCIDFTEHNELQESRRALAHVSRVLSMGELAGSLAHELNQPLTAILSNAQAARRFMAAESIDLTEVRNTLDDVVGNTKRASEVIRRMGALVKRGELAVTAVDAGEVVREVAALVRSEAIARGAQVLINIEPGLPAVRADQVQLQQVVLNLLINAFDAMKDLPREDRVAEVRVARDGDAGVSISVIDRGGGLTGDNLENIFKPFYTTKRDGLGLGLSISRSIIEAHGGILHVENNAGHGVTFSFVLPFAVAADARQRGGGHQQALPAI